MAENDTDGAFDADTGGVIVLPTASKSPRFSAIQPEDIAFRFLDLPTELRDMIYDYVWMDMGSIKRRKKFEDYTVTYRAPIWEPNQGRQIPRRIPSWLFTSKQIMQEGLTQLRRESAWHINPTDTMTRQRWGFEACKIDTPHLLPSNVVYLEVSDKYEMVFHWCSRKNVHVFHDSSARLSSFLRTFPEAVQIRTFVLQIHARIDYITDCDLVWRQTPCPHTPFPCPQTPCKRNHTGEVSFDLSLLEQLRSCSQLTKFCIQLTNMAGDYVFYEKLATLKSTWALVNIHLQGFADAASSVGKGLVEGGRETFTNLDHYWEEIEDARSKDKYLHKVVWRYSIERL